MTHNALRKGRYSTPGQIYFVTTVSRARQPFFADFNCARMVIREMQRLQDEGCVESLAWVLMPDHLHWLFGLSPQYSLAQVMRYLKGRSAWRWHALSAQPGLWQESYFDHALRKEEDLQNLARYIVANPLRKGLVKSVKDYSHWDAVWL